MCIKKAKYISSDRFCNNTMPHIQVLVFVLVLGFLLLVARQSSLIFPTSSSSYRATKATSAEKSAAVVHCPQPDNNDAKELHGGDCQAFGKPRRPSWACPKAIRATLQEFLKVYDQRPIQDNKGGMRIEHAFALWYTVKVHQPKYVVESGAKDGQSTWIITQAFPKSIIYSIDPRRNPPKVYNLPNVKYYMGKDFVDFAQINWKDQDIDPKRTLVFFDDHQSEFRRLKEAISNGFRKIIFEDNYLYMQGDTYTMKWVCEREGKHTWSGSVLDNFGKVNISKTWDEHLKDGDELSRLLKSYYEFPPIVNPWLAQHTRFPPNRSTPPLVNTWSGFRKLGLDKYPLSEFGQYAYFLIVEVHSYGLQGRK